MLPFDLGGTANKLATFGSQVMWLSLLVVAAGLAIPAAARVGSLLARGWLRFVGAGIALAIGIAGEFVLPNDYPSVHLYISWIAAVIGGAALAGVRLPRIAGRVPGIAIRAPLAGFAAWAVIVPPRFSLSRELFDAPGAGHRAAPREAPAVGGDGRVSTRLGAARRARVEPLAPAAGAHHARVRDRRAARGCRRERAVRRQAAEHRGAPPRVGAVHEGALGGERHHLVAREHLLLRYYSELYWKPRPGGAETLSYPYLDKSVRFPEILRGAGVGTFSSTQMPDVENAIGDCGVLRGFSTERLIPPSRPAQGGIVTDAAVAELRRARGGPLFMYVHYLDTHAPYHGGKQGDAPFVRYLAQVSLVDGFLGRLRKEIADLGLTDRTTIILAADHGEAFGEHQTWFHAVSVYEELLRVPLLVHIPGVAPRRVDTEVTLMDLGPTILDLFGQTTPGSYMGQSLVPFLRGQSPVLTRPIAAETGRLQRALIFPDGFKVIEDLYRNTVEAYDLKKDPRELANLIDGMDPRSEVRLRETRAFFERNAYHQLGYRPPYRP